MFNQMRKSGKIPNLQASANQSPYSFYPHRKSPYQLRDEGFYGRSSMHQQQQPMMAGPDPFYAMRGQEMDTRKIDKIFDKWNEEAAEKAQAEAQNGGGGGGMEGAGQILGMVMQFAPMLMG
uniref:Uncharacterized protein n=1 Tax=Panagrolaimus sp. PS1159 TaxID=55785 RepID=A0AC35FXC2_9BILA